MKTILKWLGYGFLGLLGLMAVFILYGTFAYREIPREEVIARQGGENLHFADIAGTRIAYRTWGQEGPVMILIPNMFMTMDMFEEQAKILARTHRVYAMDLTGHGFTGPDLTGDYTPERQTVILDAFMNHIKAEKAVFVGSSTGGTMSFMYAAAHPDRVSGLVLINSGGFEKVGQKKANVKPPAFVWWIFRYFPDMAYRGFINWIAVKHDHIPDAFYDKYIEQARMEGNRQGLSDRLFLFKIDRIPEILATVKAPVLILWGGKNPQLERAHLPKFKAALKASPAVEIKVYEDAGHVLPLEIPNETAAAIGAFVKRDVK